VVSGICLAGGGPTGRRSSPNGWGAASLAVKPRLLNAAQWRLVIEQRRDLDDELRRLTMQETEPAALTSVPPRQDDRGEACFPGGEAALPSRNRSGARATSYSQSGF